MLHDSALDEKSSQLASQLAPTLALLRAVAAEGHLTRAGERLGMPQPTVSRTLARLAERLGHPLLAQRGRGVVLTRAGLQLAAAAEDSLRTLESGCQRVIEDLDPDRGQVSFGFQHTMGSTLVPPLLRGFRDQFPQVRFQLAQGARDDLLARTATGELDLCLVSPLPAEERWETAPLRTESLVVVVPDTHQFGHRRELRFTEVSEEGFVVTPHGYGLRHIFMALAERSDTTPRVTFEVEDVDTARGLVAAGLGIALLPPAETGSVPGTTEIPLRPREHRTIGLAWPARLSLPPAGARFRDFARSTAQSRDPADH